MKISKYKLRILRERANAACSVTYALEEAWRKNYVDRLGFKHPQVVETFQFLLQAAQAEESRYNREYKDALK